MRIIDAHTHIFPDKIALKASKSIGAFYDLPMYDNATVSRLFKNGNKIGIERYLVCSSAVVADQVESINDFIASECSQHSELIGLAALHRDFKNYEEELDRIMAMGLVGVKFHNDFQKFYIDDEKMFPIYKAIAKRGLKVLFHMGDDRYEYTAPSRLYKVCKRVPDLIAIGAHFGGYRRWDEAYSIPVMENIYYDTSSSLAFLDRDQALRLIDKFGTDRFLFGTDFPMWEAEKELERFLDLGLDRKSNEDILYNNFAKLFFN